MLVHLFHEAVEWLYREIIAAEGVRNISLSPREEEVLRLLLKRSSEKQIALHLGLRRPTIHEYVISLYRKFDVHSRAELLAKVLGPSCQNR